MRSVFSAPGKVILSGEHSVVYGRPALVAAIDRRVVCTLARSARHSKNPRYVHVFEKIVTDYLSRSNIHFTTPHYKFFVKSGVPTKRNLGSSAALSAAACASMLDFFSEGRKFSPDVINKLAYKGEKYFHGNPSGVDNSASVFGGLIYYRKEFEFLCAHLPAFQKCMPFIQDAS